MQSLELLLDEDADAAVRELWERLRAAGLPSQAEHRGPSNAPHVTLVAARAVALPHDVVRLPVPLVLGSPVLFGAGSTRTLALAVIPSDTLLELHAAVVAAAAPVGSTAHTLPGAWTPHVTLARRVPVDDLGRAVAACGGLGDLVASATRLRHWDPATGVVTPVRARA